MSEALVVSTPSALMQPAGSSLSTTAGGLVAFPVPAGRYAIPMEEMQAFTELSTREQERIRDHLLPIFEQMESDPAGIVRASERIAFQLRSLRGYSASNLRNNYYAWREGGWRELIRKYNNGHQPLPKAFVDHIRALMEQNGRSMLRAMKVLQRQWASGQAIPGYGTWREWYFEQNPDLDIPSVFPGCYPPGWKKSNLYALQPKKATRALMTRGPGAMKAHMPSIIRDTSSLLPLQLITIDDFETDHLCFFWDPVTRKRELCPVTGVAAMDVATRKIIGVILKPRGTDYQGNKQRITRSEVRLLLWQILRDYGVPEHGMTILAEKAAAAVTKELQMTFGNLFGGRVAITRTSTICEKTLSNGFIAGGGKPWLKGWIESFFNLLANEAATIRGYKGSHYSLKPAELENKKQVVQRLIGHGPKDAQLSDAQLARAPIPFLRHDELIEQYLKIFDLLDRRDDHQMLGFEDTMVWRAGPHDHWHPIEEAADLTPEQQLACEWEPRRQSPLQRWQALFPQIRRQAVDPAALMVLCLTPKEATWKSQKLTLTHNGKGYTFAQHGTKLANLAEGSKFLVYFDRSNATSAHVCHLDGRYICEVRRFGPVDITDQDAVSDAEKQLAEIYNGLRAEVRARPLHQATDAQLAAEAAQREQIVADATKERGITATLNRALPAASDRPETATALHSASQIAASADATAQRDAEAKRLRRPVSPQAAGNALSDLVQVPCTEAADDAPSAPPSLSDLL